MTDFTRLFELTVLTKIKEGTSVDEVIGMFYRVERIDKVGSVYRVDRVEAAARVDKIDRVTALVGLTE